MYRLLIILSELFLVYILPTTLVNTRISKNAVVASNRGSWVAAGPRLGPLSFLKYNFRMIMMLIIKRSTTN